jgi:hypothetical protein
VSLFISEAIIKIHDSSEFFQNLSTAELRYVNVESHYEAILDILYALIEHLNPLKLEQIVIGIRCVVGVDEWKRESKTYGWSGLDRVLATPRWRSLRKLTMVVTSVSSEPGARESGFTATILKQMPLARDRGLLV